MKTIHRSLHALAMACAMAFCQQPAAAQQAPVRILPLGDSITQGQTEPVLQGGYRKLLYSRLTTNGFNVDFVGAISDGVISGLPDTDHQGMAGKRVDELVDLVANGGLLDSFEDPDVVLLMIGTNDFLQTWRNEQPAAVLAELDTLVAEIAVQRPFAKIIVATLTLNTSGWTYGSGETVEQRQQLYNQGIPALVEEQAALGRQVSWVDLHPVLVPGDLYDGTHLTAAGYDKLAEAWLPAVQAVIAPQGTANRPHVAWIEPPAQPTQLKMVFSKPIADAAAAPANFSISGGVSVTGATLDAATKRIVTLTTSQQTPNTTYTVTVNGVTDRTPQPHAIAPQTKVLFDSNVLANSSFENQLVDWTHSGNVAEVNGAASPFYDASDGSRLAVFNAAGGHPNGSLSQSFATLPGKTYRLLYDSGAYLGSFGTWKLKFNVSATGSGSLFSSTDEISNNSGGSGSVRWFPFAHTFTANSANTTLSFLDVSSSAYTSNRDLLLDNIRLFAEQPAVLTATSTPDAGVAMTITPSDQNNAGSGSSGLVRAYTPGTEVTVTAPQTAGGRYFQNWQLNGADIPSSGTSITLTLDANTAINAVYDPEVSILPPVASADSYSTNEDNALSVAASGVLANDTDPNPLPLTASLASGPSHGSLTLNANGGFVYTPAANYHGGDSFTYLANNGAFDSPPATVTINVAAVNDTPVAVADTLAATEDTPVTYPASALLANDTDIDGNTLAIAGVSGAVLNGNGSVTFTPAANFNGSTSFSYTVTDGTATSAPATVTINVAAVNDAPVAVADTLAATEDTPVTFPASALLANDTDIDGDTLAIASVSGAVLNGNGTVTFTPAENFNGSTSFTYTVTDGTATSAPATVTINVAAVNDAPVAVADTLAATEDTPVTYPASALLANDTDIDGDTLAIAGVSGAVLNGNGSVTFTPAANFNGSTSFTYTVTDGTATSAPATVTINVAAVNDTPVAGSQSIEVDEDNPVSITLTGSDVENEPLTFEVITSTCCGRLDGSGAQLTFTPDADFHGIDSFVFVANDGTNNSAPATVTIIVRPVNDAPVAADRSVETAEDTPLGIELAAADVDGDPLAFAVIEQPAHGTLTGTPPQLTYTPAANYHGTDSFRFTASDGIAPPDEAVVSITVTEVGGSPFVEWLAGSNLVAPPDADSDNDSIANGIEYVIGADPLNRPDSDMLPTFTPDGAGHMVFAYRRTSRAFADALTTIGVEWSTDLAGPWMPGDGTHGETITVDEDAAGPGIDVVQVSIPLPTEGRLFARLRVVVADGP